MVKKFQKELTLKKAQKLLFFVSSSKGEKDYFFDAEAKLRNTCDAKKNKLHHKIVNENKTEVKTNLEKLC